LNLIKKFQSDLAVNYFLMKGK